MRAHFPTEAKVGIFVIVTVLALAYLTIRINKTGFSLSKSKTIYAVFDDASGLLPRTPVEFAGIRVGTVNSIELIDGKARVEILLRSNVPIYQDSIVSLQNRGLLGEKIVTISGGGAMAEIPDGGVIVAQGSGRGFEDAIRNFNDVASAIRDLIKGGEGRPSLKDIVNNITDVTDDLRTVVRGNRKQLDEIIDDVHTFASMLNDGDLKLIIQNLKTTSETIKTFVADANPQLRDVVGDFKAVMAKVDTTVESLNRIVSRVERGEGTVGKLLSDETTVNKVNDTLDGINEFVSRIKRLELAVGYRAEFLSTDSELQSTASFRLQPSYDKYFLFEFTDGPLSYAKRTTTITDTTTTPPGATVSVTEQKRTSSFTFTALFARRFYDLTLKAGIIRSSGGFGAEYHLFKDRLSFGFDAFDFQRDNNLHMRAYIAAHLWKVFHITGGVDDIFEGNRRRNYFGGLGVMLTDNDLKSLIGLAPLVQ